jgi:transketolase
MPVATSSIQQLSINTIRTLSMDGVQAANSGHPGTPMALAPLTYVLWNQVLRYDPAQPQWPGRDRFVLSCGHASMLLYSMLHLAGVKREDGSESISLDNIKNFRQLNSPCAGHPEYSYAPGIETTTGPLGQGVSNSVGMAMAAKWFEARYNKPGFDLFGFNTYALCSDGDLMEGVANEAASIAGHLKLNNLCWVYDDNHITIEGETDLAFSENVGKRFEGLGWNVVKVADANDTTAFAKALDAFSATKDKPTLIIVRSIIGYGAPNKQNTHGAHGAPLGDSEIALAKKFYGWPEDKKFYVPNEVREDFANGVAARGAQLHEEWDEKFGKYKSQFAKEAAELEAMWNRKLPPDWEAALPTFPADAKGLATRVSSGKVLNAIAPKFPWLVGGSADLAPSTMTNLDAPEMGSYGHENYAGRNLHFGIREHGMAAACNGMSLCGIRPYGATFFVFTDYMRGSMRLSSIMHQPVLYVLTHDSIGLGEDGPTHQPIEHLAAMRAIPRMIVMRPGDANEVAECYRALLKINNRPVSLVLSRQNVPTLDRTKYAPAAGAGKGAYVLADAANGKPEVILMATGTELIIALQAYEQLTAQGVAARCVSMPSWELFEMQNQAYRDSVLPPAVKARVAIEAGIKQGWERWIGDAGRFIGMNDFGASGPYQKLYEKYGLTPERVAAEAKAALGK